MSKIIVDNNYLIVVIHIRAHGPKEVAILSLRVIPFNFLVLSKAILTFVIVCVYVRASANIYF